MSDWKYTGGVNASTCVRTYRKGVVGMVVRTRRHLDGFGEPKRRYFVWGLKDASPEYETEAAARKAARTAGFIDEVGVSG